MINRAYVVSSTFHNFHLESDILKQYFTNNGFSQNMFTSIVKRFLDRKYSPNRVTPVDDRTKFYVSLPYFGSQSDKLQSDLKQLLAKYFPHINFILISTNPFKIGSFFQFKDKLPVALRSKLIYKFSCSHCESSYVGSTTRTLGQRIAEHAGKSYRTNRFLSSPSHSSVREHCNSCNSIVNQDNFSILCHSTASEIRILESLYIFKLKPDFNNTLSAFPLSI